MPGSSVEKGLLLNYSRVVFYRLKTKNKEIQNTRSEETEKSYRSNFFIDSRFPPDNPNLG